MESPEWQRMAPAGYAASGSQLWGAQTRSSPHTHPPGLWDLHNLDRAFGSLVQILSNVEAGTSRASWHSPTTARGTAFSALLAMDLSPQA